MREALLKSDQVEERTKATSLDKRRTSGAEPLDQVHRALIAPQSKCKSRVRRCFRGRNAPPRIDLIKEVLFLITAVDFFPRRSSVIDSGPGWRRAYFMYKSFLLINMIARARLHIYRHIYGGPH